MYDKRCYLINGLSILSNSAKSILKHMTHIPDCLVRKWNYWAEEREHLFDTHPEHMINCYVHVSYYQIPNSVTIRVHFGALLLHQYTIFCAKVDSILIIAALWYF